MIGLDTNVLLRVLMDDGDPQVVLARAYFTRHCGEAESAFVSTVVLAETVWVLERSYRLDKQEVMSVIELLLGTRQFLLAERDLVQSAFLLYSENSLGFTDALIGEIDRAAGCSTTATFDRKAAKLDGFELVR